VISKRATKKKLDAKQQAVNEGQKQTRHLSKRDWIVLECSDIGRSL
jgi:hypothetical protein